MDPADDDFLRELHQTFLAEAQEHVEAIAASLVAVEQTKDSETAVPLIDAMYRETHSLKGAAGAAGSPEVAGKCSEFENHLTMWKQRAAVPSSREIDTISALLDSITALISGSDDSEVTPVARTISAPAPITRPSKPPPPRHKPRTGPPTGQGIPDESEPTLNQRRKTDTRDTGAVVRVSEGRVDDLLLVSEELLSAKIANERHVGQAWELAHAAALWRKKWANARATLPSRSNMHTSDIDTLLELIERAAVTAGDFADQATALAGQVARDRRLVDPLVDDLLSKASAVVLAPFSSITGMLPKLVRDLARQEGKAADVAIIGAEIELDRRVLEKLKDPLVHSIRNAVSHGIEAPDERERRGKPIVGHVSVQIERLEGNRVCVTVSDDGQGLNLVNLRRAARRTDGGSGQTAEFDASTLAFRMGVSTAATVTDIAGRGVGLSAIRENIDGLEGDVELSSTPGRGAQLRMIVPTSRSSMHGVIVEIGDRPYAIPSTKLQAVVRIRRSDVTDRAGVPTAFIDDSLTPVMSLARAIGIRESQPAKELPANDDHVSAIILGSGLERIALTVDQVLYEQAILLKPLGRQIGQIASISGATVLANGLVAPVLEPRGVLAAAHTAQANGTFSMSTPTIEDADDIAEDKPRAVLVVDDSMTSRMVISNILTHAGYAVQTAVDGADALRRLHGDSFDAVVSDVEMPNIDGFALTESIRADEKIANIPIVLVTSRSSEADRQRGLDAGANAYLVKNDFDQFKLLERLDALT